MYCTEDCRCSLCRELRGYRHNNARPKVPSAKASTGMIPVGNSNFILRRSKPELDRHKDEPGQQVTERSTKNQHKVRDVDDAEHSSASSQTDHSASTALKEASSASSSPSQSPSQSQLPAAPSAVKRNNDQHKVIIYFGDSLSSKQQLVEAERLHKHRQAPAPIKCAFEVSTAKPITLKTESCAPMSVSDLPSFVESIEGNIINIRVEGSFTRAEDIVRAVKEVSSAQGIDDDVLDDNSDAFDWSFVQNWRSRPSANSHSDQSQFNNSPSSSSAAVQPPAAVLRTAVSNPHHPQNAHHATGHTTTNSSAAINKPNSQPPQQQQQHHSGATAMFSATPQAVASSLVCSGQIHGPAVATPAPRLPREQIAKYPPVASDSQAASQFLHSPPSVAHNFKPRASPSGVGSGPDDAPPSLPHHHQHFYQQQQQQQQRQPHGSTAMLIPERDTGPTPSPPTSAATPCPPLAPLPNGKSYLTNNNNRNSPSVPPHRSMSGPAKLTIQSIPVKSQPPMLSSGLGSQHRSTGAAAALAAPQTPQHRSNQQYAGGAQQLKSPLQTPTSTVQLTSPVMPTRPPISVGDGAVGVVAVPARTVTHHQHHISSAASEFRSGMLHRVPESSCHSSSDENRSSGHASMSDTGGHGSSSPGGHMEFGDSTEHLSGGGAVVSLATTSMAASTANAMSSSGGGQHSTVHVARAMNGSIAVAGCQNGGPSSGLPAVRQAVPAQHAQQNRSHHQQQQQQHPQQRHHRQPLVGGGSAAHNAGKVPWNGGGGLADIKLAIQQLTMRSQTSTNSTYSSLSAGSESSEPAAVRRGGPGNSSGAQNGQQGNSGGGGAGGGGNGNGAGVAGGNKNNGNSNGNNNNSSSGNNNGGGGGLGRYASLETVNTNVTSADEFVWVDSHNRLVELQHPPWSQHCVWRVIRSGRCRELSDRVAADAVPRLGYLLQRALVRVAREVQRLSAGLGLCSKHEVAGAFRIVVCPALADSCIKACLRAAAMFAVPGDGALRQSKSARAGLQLPVGRFHRWMADAKLGRFVHEYAAVYLCAGVENLLEEILLQCLKVDGGAVGNGGNAGSKGHNHAAQMLLLKQQQQSNNNNGVSAAGNGSGNVQAAPSLTAASLEQAIAACGDLWGLLQPYAHLNAGRVASGALTMPRWTSQAAVNQATAQPGSNVEPCLLTTCVGSASELRDLILRAQARFQNVALSQAALTALFYFMRCSQLEHSDASSNISGGNNNIQELCYERAYVVLPPLVEWLRVATAHADYRNSSLIDTDDILQAARLLLPGVDCPPRPLACDEDLPSKRTACVRKPTPSSTAPIVAASSSSLNASSCASSSSSTTSSGIADDIAEYGRRSTLALAFKLMTSGRPELLLQASALLPVATRYDTLNQTGMTALMVAAVRNDEQAVQMLLDVGANPNIEVPMAAGGTVVNNAVHPETQQWTAVTFAACRGAFTIVRLLLERGAHVEGGARLSDERCTLTPLQVASGSGHLDVVALLLSYGAHAFLSTQQKDSLCFSGNAQRGCFSAISVAAAHGQRTTLRKLLTHPLAPGSREVLSLEEMLAEGDGQSVRPSVREELTGADAMGQHHQQARQGPPATTAKSLTKTQIKSLQEAMYHSAENNHLDITVELRAVGVPWTLHCWMHALAAAHELRLDAVIDQLLQDFLQVCPDDYSTQFVSECLPLLFNIFRYSKKEGTTLLLADIFATCFGWDTIKHIKEPVLLPCNGSRIDPKFVNNPELSDVTFRVEGKIFYGHKIVLVTASARFKSMLSSKLSEGNPPTVQINDIRYHIFQLVMQFLYSGGCNKLEVVAGDVLELMAAASFFQLDGLLRYTESRCSHMIDIDNVVAMYIHAKVYNAVKLLEYCQGFLLQNMVALLTYDDSVKRLLFGKKIPNHDVLSGLLGTLQARIKARRAAPSFTGTTTSSSSGGQQQPTAATAPHNRSTTSLQA